MDDVLDRLIEFDSGGLRTTKQEIMERTLETFRARDAEIDKERIAVQHLTNLHSGRRGQRIEADPWEITQNKGINYYQIERQSGPLQDRWT